MAIAVHSVPGKKVLFASTIARFYVQGTLLRQLSPTELAKYLGLRYGYLGQSKPLIDSLQAQLSRLRSAPLKPDQKLCLLKTYLLPRLLSTLMNVRVTKGILRHADRLIRVAVRKMLHLNRSCAAAYLHTPVRYGGLGITCFTTQVPPILSRRIANIEATADAVTVAVLALHQCRRLRQKFLSWTEEFGTTKSAMGRKWADTLETSFSGNGLLQGRSSGASGD